MSKKLIAYFSRADENYFGGTLKYISVGNTEIVAKKIQEKTGADIFKIEMVKPYSKNYQQCIDEAKRDKNSNARPQLVSYHDSIDEYDTIYLGYPNYWGTMPMAVFAFLERYDFSGKTIKPFCTHEGSGMGSSERDLKKICPDSNIQKGLAIHGSSANSAENAVENWL